MPNQMLDMEGKIRKKLEKQRDERSVNEMLFNGATSGVMFKL
jgi:hypothetical protein